MNGTSTKFRFKFAGAVQLLVTLVFLALATGAHSANRHALVIGNSNYGSGFSLINPLNDSTAIAARLSSIGYDVHGGGALLDLGLDQFNDEIDNFLRSVEDGSSTLIYYAGHGAASAGSNFLIPILPEGVTLRSESDIRDRSISLQSIIERTDQRNPSGVNVFLFDACRDAPVESHTRSINLSGLTSLDTRRQPRGSFVGFSTEYGKLALDDNDNGHSPFASAILSGLENEASMPIELFYKSVTEDVYDKTSGQQFPIQESKIRGDFCIVECKNVSANEVDSVQEYGTLSVVTKPVDAEVCYLIPEWDGWNCGQQMVLPIGKPVEVRVSASKYKQSTTSTTVNEVRQQLVVSLEPKSRINYKILGTVAAVIVTGLLLSSKSGGSGDSEDDEFTVTLNPPSQ